MLAMAAAIGSLFHQAGKIWANGYGSGVLVDSSTPPRKRRAAGTPGCSGRESAMER
jgi:hypothetical protein